MKAFAAALSLLLAASFSVSAPSPSREPTNAEEAAQKKAAAEAEVAAKYESWVAALSPERQAWEKVLRENLGSFYLPLHQRDKVAGKSNAWDFVEDDPALPRVLLIGDSVSRAYTGAVRKALAGKANVHRAPANCGPTKAGVEKLEVWIGEGSWDLIHFNFGIHDRATPPEDYRDRLAQIVDRLAATGAKLVWATTTPIPDVEAKGFAAKAIVERNAVAAEVMAAKSVAVNDLFSAVTPHLAEYRLPDDVHFNGAGYGFLAERVVEAIDAALPSGR